MDPEQLRDKDVAREAVKGAQFWRKKSRTLAQTTDCYVKHCQGENKSCTSPEDREEFMGCVDNEVKGIGKKSQDLMREYLGDGSAVAVDRHIADWACNEAKLCKGPEKKGKMIKKEDYENIAGEVRKKARDVGMDPSELQISIWVSGACQSHGIKPFYLGDDKVIQCGERGHRTLEEF